MEESYEDKLQSAAQQCHNLLPKLFEEIEKIDPDQKINIDQYKDHYEAIKGLKRYGKMYDPAYIKLGIEVIDEYQNDPKLQTPILYKLFSIKSKNYKAKVNIEEYLKDLKASILHSEDAILKYNVDKKETLRSRNMCSDLDYSDIIDNAHTITGFKIQQLTQEKARLEKSSGLKSLFFNKEITEEKIKALEGAIKCLKNNEQEIKHEDKVITTERNPDTQTQFKNLKTALEKRSSRIWGSGPTRSMRSLSKIINQHLGNER